MSSGLRNQFCHTCYFWTEHEKFAASSVLFHVDQGTDHRRAVMAVVRISRIEVTTSPIGVSEKRQACPASNGAIVRVRDYRTGTRIGMCSFLYGSTITPYLK